MWHEGEYLNKELFWLLLLIPVLILWYWRRYRHQYGELKLSFIPVAKRSSSSFRGNFIHVLFFIRLLVLGLLITALARPRSSLNEQEITSEGIDIVLVMDVSGSMLAEDFRPNRIEAAKKVASNFISGRPDDRIGVVVFAGESFTQCPITTDHVVLKNLMNDIKSGLIEDGTAIGMGLATAVNRLKESKVKSKVVVLLTDGVNNSGFISPITATEIAKKFNIRVYTIGVGTIGFAPYPVKTPFGVRHQQMEVKIDEELLTEIAQLTDGKYYRATSNSKLEKIYQEIDQLEKTKIEISTIERYKDEYLKYAIWAVILLMGELFFRYTIFRRVT